MRWWSWWRDGPEVIIRTAFGRAAHKLIAGCG